MCSTKNRAFSESRESQAICGRFLPPAKTAPNGQKWSAQNWPSICMSIACARESAPWRPFSAASMLWCSPRESAKIPSRSSRRGLRPIVVPRRAPRFDEERSGQERPDEESTRRRTRNRPLSKDTDIAAPDAPVRVLVIHAQEDWMIARQCRELVKTQSKPAHDPVTLITASTAGIGVTL